MVMVYHLTGTKPLPEPMAIFHQIHLQMKFQLTHWGLVAPNGDIDLGQHWLR